MVPFYQAREPGLVVFWLIIQAVYRKSSDAKDVKADEQKKKFFPKSFCGPCLRPKASKPSKRVLPFITPIFNQIFFQKDLLFGFGNKLSGITAGAAREFSAWPTKCTFRLPPCCAASMRDVHDGANQSRSVERKLRAAQKAD